MEALQALQQRVSSPKLCEPAPSADQRQAIFQAALRAADHANLRPWRFIVVEGDARRILGELFLQVSLAKTPELDEAQRAKILSKPFRAPLILVAVAPYTQHPKVPELELQLSCAAAVQNILNAAFALNVGAYWRTGSMAFSEQVNEGLGLAAKDQIVGFIYMGTPDGRTKPVPSLNVDDFFQPLEV